MPCRRCRDAPCLSLTTKEERVIETGGGAVLQEARKESGEECKFLGEHLISVLNTDLNQKPGKNVDEAEAFSQSRQPKNVEVEQTVELEAELRDAAAEVLDSEAPEHQESDHNATTHTEERSSASPGGTLEENALEEAAFGKTAVEVRVVLGKNAEVYYQRTVDRLWVLMSSEDLGL